MANDGPSVRITFHFPTIDRFLQSTYSEKNGNITRSYLVSKFPGNFSLHNSMKTAKTETRTDAAKEVWQDWSQATEFVCSFRFRFSTIREFIDLTDSMNEWLNCSFQENRAWAKLKIKKVHLQNELWKHRLRLKCFILLFWECTWLHDMLK